jgi:hypothetical protein
MRENRDQSSGIISGGARVGLVCRVGADATGRSGFAAARAGIGLRPGVASCLGLGTGFFGGWTAATGLPRTGAGFALSSGFGSCLATGAAGAASGAGGSGRPAQAARTPPQSSIKPTRQILCRSIYPPYASGLSRPGLLYAGTSQTPGPALGGAEAVGDGCPFSSAARGDPANRGSFTQPEDDHETW